MKHRPVHGSTSSLFLIELIIAAGFFSLTAAACVRLYLYAREVSAESSDVTHAVNEAQNMAESYLAGDGSLADGIRLYAETADAAEEVLSAVSNAFSSDPAEAIFGYDDDWVLLPDAASDACSYFMTVTLEENPEAAGTSVLHICILKNAAEEVLFELETARYLPAGKEGS